MWGECEVHYPPVRPQRLSARKARCIQAQWAFSRLCLPLVCFTHRSLCDIWDGFLTAWLLTSWTLTQNKLRHKEDTRFRVGRGWWLRCETIGVSNCPGSRAVVSAFHGGLLSWRSYSPFLCLLPSTFLSFVFLSMPYLCWARPPSSAEAVTLWNAAMTTRVMCFLDQRASA